MVVSPNEAVQLREAINEVRDMALVVTTKFAAHEAEYAKQQKRIDDALAAIHRGVVALFFMSLSGLCIVVWYIITR